jgi:hypothetical protein
MSLALAGFGSYAYYTTQMQSLPAASYAAETAASVTGHHDWIPLLCVLVFTTALALGVSPISWLLIGELFPLEYRGLGSSISTSFSYFCAFVAIKLYMDFQVVSEATIYFISELPLSFLLPLHIRRERDELNIPGYYHLLLLHIPVYSFHSILKGSLLVLCLSPLPPPYPLLLVELRAI